MPKLYTKTGDKGKTSLFDMRRIQKDEIFFTVLGDTDELSSHIGVLCVKLTDTKLNRYYKVLRHIQAKLIDIGSIVATLKKSRPIINDDDIKFIENEIDYCESQNSKLTAFILPGINDKDAQAHVCRSVTRKLERHMWKLHFSSKEVSERNSFPESVIVQIPSNVLKYVNRLSDYFFALARNLSNGNDIKAVDYLQLNINE